MLMKLLAGYFCFAKVHFFNELVGVFLAIESKLISKIKRMYIHFILQKCI